MLIKPVLRYEPRLPGERGQELDAPVVGRTSTGLGAAPLDRRCRGSRRLDERHAPAPKRVASGRCAPADAESCAGDAAAPKNALR